MPHLLLPHRGTSANTVVKIFDGERPEDGTGKGQAAGKPLNESYNNHTEGGGEIVLREAGQCQDGSRIGAEGLFFFFSRKKYRDHLEATEMTLHHERCETPDTSRVSGDVLACNNRCSC